MDNKRKRLIVDIVDDSIHIQKIMKINESPYDADDEDSSSDSESHVQHNLAAANYFTHKVDIEADSGYLLKNVFVYDSLSPNINHSDNSSTDSTSYQSDSQAAEEPDFHECLAGVPLDYWNPEVDEFICDSGYMLENLCYNRTLSSKIANSKNSQTVGVLYSKLSVKERLAAVPIDKTSSVIDLTSTDDESSVTESAVSILISLPEEAN